MELYIAKGGKDKYGTVLLKDIHSHLKATITMMSVFMGN